MSLLIAKDRVSRILGLALPIIGGMLSQNVLNLVDTAMVGELGDSALAAVGIASFTNFMCIALITGLSSGVQAMASRRLGEGKEEETAVPLNGGLLIALGIGLPLSVLLHFLAPHIFLYLSSKQAVIDQGTPYLQMRLLAMVGVGMNFAFRGYWNGVNLSKLYMRTLLIMHVSNIFLNWVLIFGHLGMPAMGTAGAGLGTAISTYIGTFTYIFLGWRHARKSGFLAGIPPRSQFATMSRLALPAALQQFFFAAGMTLFFRIVGTIGIAQLAAANVLINLLLVAILPGMGFGFACASLVGQALGRKEIADAKQWGWEVSRLAAVIVGSLGFAAFVFPEFFLSGFLKNSSTVALARLPLQLTALTISLDTVGLVLLQALLGAGDSRRVMLVATGLQWLLFLPAAYMLGPVFGFGLLAVWVAQLAYRGIQSVVFLVMWQRGKWTEIKV